MSKERLEEIITRLKYGLGCLKHLRREILNSDDESLKDQINLLENDIKYLFEQAERVRELEVWYHSYHKEAKLNNILKIQNKRYREAILLAYYELGFALDETEIDKTKERIMQAKLILRNTNVLEEIERA